MIESLTEFTVIPEYHGNRTAYHIHAKDGEAPVAQLRKDDAYDSPVPLQLFTGPGLDQPAGWVTSKAAMGPDRVRVGVVNLDRKVLSGKAAWTFSQDGLPELRGERVGSAGAIRENWLVRDYLTSGLADGVLSFHARFSAPGCAGFELTRPAGLKARYKVRVHDERVSRLLILACIAKYSAFTEVDPRKNLADLTYNPFKKNPFKR